MTKQMTQGLGGIAIVVIAAAAALLLLASTALAAGTVTGSTATVAAGASAQVTITGNAGTGHGIGSYTIDVAVASTLTLPAGAAACTSHAAGDCNNLGGNAIRFAGSTGSATGLTGDQILGTVNISANALTAGQCADVTITVSEFNDETGAALGPTATKGQVCVAATAAPTTAAPTASPTAAKLPSTGGPTDTSGPSSLVWLLAAAGLIVVSGAAWALSRARREI